MSKRKQQTRRMPESISDTPENIARALVTSAPKGRRRVAMPRRT